jgi:hypothetical protein
MAAVIGGILTLPFVVVALPFWAIAWLTRTVARQLRPQAASWHEAIEFHPIVGWKPKSNLDAYCSFAAGMFHIQTDSDGWRGQASLDESHIVVFGDSVAFGYGVDEEKTFFSSLVGKLRIKPIGSPGYNMVQELLWMHQLASQLRGKLVVWFIYHGNDLYDNLIPNLSVYRMPFVRQVNGAGSWEIVRSHVTSTKWPSAGEHNLRLKEKWKATFVAGPRSERAFNACEFLLTQGRDLCYSMDARLVIMSIPWPNELDSGNWNRIMSRFGDPKSFDSLLPDRRISEICSRLGVPVVTAKDYLDFPDHIPGDGHWNETGHQRIRNLLESLYDCYVGRCEQIVKTVLELKDTPTAPDTCKTAGTVR